MLVHTGNVQPYCQLYPDLKKTTTEEIITSIEMKMEKHNNESICLLDTNHQTQKIPEGIPPENIVLQVKLFISNMTTEEDVIRAVDTVLSEFPQISQINYLYLATPGKTDKDILLKCWPWFEELAKFGKILHLGLSDPRCQTLQPLIEACELRPSGIQLKFVCEHISDTCIDLLKLANYYKITVTIHRDDLVSVSELKEAIKPKLNVDISESWLVKYSTFDKKRKVILKKGYMMEREC